MKATQNREISDWEAKRKLQKLARKKAYEAWKLRIKKRGKTAFRTRTNAQKKKSDDDALAKSHAERTGVEKKPFEIKKELQDAVTESEDILDVISDETATKTEKLANFKAKYEESTGVVLNEVEATSKMTDVARKYVLIVLWIAQEHVRQVQNVHMKR